MPGHGSTRAIVIPGLGTSKYGKALMPGFEASDGQMCRRHAESY